MSPRPFPYERLPRLSHRQRALLSNLEQLFDVSRTQSALETARALLGRDLEVRLGLADAADAHEIGARCNAAPGVALLLEHGSSARPAPCAVELTRQAARHLVDRALGGDGGDGGEEQAEGLLPLDELSRVIGRVEHFKPYARLLNCDAAGLTELEWPKRADPALFKQLERTKAPLVYRWRREGAKIQGGEPLGPGA